MLRAALIGLAAGALGFALGPGPGVWSGDPALSAPPRDWAMAVSGALAFLADDWRWPLFRIEGFAEHVPVSAVFTDSWPLLALIWKLGGWEASSGAYLSSGLALLFLLQGGAGGLALALLGLRGGAVLFLGATILCLWPPFLYRVPIHLGLSAHGLVLLGVAMALAPIPERAGPRMLGWAALLAIAALTHAYLLAMAGLCFAYSVAATLRWQTLVHAAAVASVLGGVLYASGYFDAPPSSAGGYGVYRFNLAAPLAAEGGSHISNLLNLPEFQDDGYLYLSVGGALLLICALGLALASRGSPEPTVLARPWPAALAVAGTLGLLLFATAGRIDWGAQRLLVLPLPELFEVAGGRLRGAARFVWLISYAAALLAIVRLSAAAGSRWGPVLLGALAVAMAVELAPLRQVTLPEAGSWSGDPVLAREIGRADRLATMPPWGCDPAHIPALDKEMQLLASVSGTRMVNSLAAARGLKLCDAPLPADLAPLPAAGALVVVKHAGRGLGPVLRAGLAPEACRLHRELALCRSDWGNSTLSSDGARRLSLPARLAFSDPETAAAHLGPGFSQAEPWGVWSVGAMSALAFEIEPAQGPLVLEVGLRGFVPAARPEARLRFLLAAEAPSGTHRHASRISLLRAAPERVLTLPLPAETRRIEITFEMDDPMRPADLGIGQDLRPLGVGLRWISVKKAAPSSP